jgi:hypothetical protein
MFKEWTGLPGVQASRKLPIPFRFSTLEIKSINEDASGAIRGMELMQSLKQSLGELWPKRRVARSDQYDQVKRLLSLAKIEMTDQLAHSEAERIGWEISWPFDDQVEGAAFSLSL